jgi:tRNA threonylcarbamoyladenosine biosynthesis protein TsaE
MTIRILAATPEDTETFGARLARVAPLDLPSALIVHLTGDLGAGKTTLARGFLKQRGHSGTVKSPTYTLFETYDFPDLSVVHLDLYRLQEPSELDALGLRDMDRPATVWLIEWPDRGAGRLPAADLAIALEAGDAAHVLTAVAHSAIGAAWLSKAS